MGRLAVVILALGANMAFGQLLGVDGFKQNKHGLYEMSFKDVREAIKKYNYVTDMNGADTNGVVFDVMKNPIDFAFFGRDIENQIISVIVTDGNRYKIMFGEFDGRYDQDFFTVISENNKPLDLIYRVK
jgi:hypothetical protein